MGDLVNLRRVRKGRERDERARQAEENRARFGQTAAEREGGAVAEAKAARHLDGHRLRSPGHED